MKRSNVLLAVAVVFAMVVCVSCESDYTGAGPEGEAVITDVPTDDAGPLFEPATEEPGEGGPSQAGKGKGAPGAQLPPVKIVQKLKDISKQAEKVEAGDEGAHYFSYDQQLTADGGSGEYEWAAKGLPKGVVLDATNKNARLKGDLHVPGKYNVLVGVRDAKHPQNWDAVAFSLAVGDVVAKSALQVPMPTGQVQGFTPCDVPLRINVKEEGKGGYVEEEGHGTFDLGEEDISITFYLELDEEAFAEQQADLKEAYPDDWEGWLGYAREMIPVRGPFTWQIESRVKDSCRIEGETDAGTPMVVSFEKMSECTKSTEEGDGPAVLTRNQSWVTEGKYAKDERYLRKTVKDGLTFTIEGQSIYDGMLPVDRPKYKLKDGGDDLSKLPQEILYVRIADNCYEGKESDVIKRQIPFNIVYPVPPLDELRVFMDRGRLNIETPDDRVEGRTFTEAVRVYLFDKRDVQLHADVEAGPYGPFMGEGTDDPIAKYVFNLFERKEREAAAVEVEEDPSLDISKIKKVVLEFDMSSACKDKDNVWVDYANCERKYSDLDLKTLTLETPYWSVVFHDDKHHPRFEENNAQASFDLTERKATHWTNADDDNLMGSFDPPNSQKWLFHRKAVPRVREQRKAHPATEEEKENFEKRRDRD